MNRGTVVGLLLAVAVLGGCTDKPQEGGTPPPVASGSPTPSASPSPKPAGGDVEQITALSRDYFAESNRALNTGDTRRFRSLFVPACSSCVKFAEYVEKHWKAGRIEAPGYWQVRQVSEALVITPTTGHSNVVYTTAKETRFDASGRIVKVNPAVSKPAALSLSLVKISGAWKVDQVAKV